MTQHIGYNDPKRHCVLVIGFLIKIIKVFNDHHRRLHKIFIPQKWKPYLIEFSYNRELKYSKVQFEVMEKLEDLVVVYKKNDVDKKFVVPLHPSNNEIFSLYEKLAKIKHGYTQSRWYLK
jgi:hypothetical protein